MKGRSSGQNGEPFIMKNIVIVILLAVTALLTSCQSPEELTYYKIAGFTQGTSYHITYATEDSVNFQPQIDSLLHSFDLSLSTYIPNSLISKVNDNESDSIDDKIIEVVNVAREVNHESDGAFDITVMPLVNAWGFGPGSKFGY